MSLISVIVPVYKVEPYLRECVDSILNQTFSDFELILVDDGSSDNCPKICDEYALKDSRIVVIHKENGGLSSARNAGIAIAKGKYLSFIDSDDYVESTFLERLVNAQIKYNADLVICSHKVTNSKNGITSKIREYNQIVLDKYTFWHHKFNMEADNVVAWNKLYKKELFNNVRYPEGKIREDEFVIHRITDRCNRIVYLPSALYIYRQNSASIMNNTDNQNKYIDYLEAIADRISFQCKKNYPQEIIYLSFNNFLEMSYMICCLKSKTKETVRKFKKIVACNNKIIKDNKIELARYKTYYNMLRTNSFVYRLYYSYRYRKERRK